MKYIKQLKLKLAMLAILSSATVLVGCGGSSSGDGTPKVPDVIPEPSDTTAPTISLTGEDNLTIFQGSTYVDEGASATDLVDGIITVTTSGAVNEAVVGEYTITYTATDAAGNESSVTRIVTVTPAVLSGTAAGGAAIVGTVVAKGSLGNVKSSVIEADGTYEVDVTGLTAPYRLRAEGTVGGKTYKLHSYAEQASVGGTVNITPFTDLIIANTAQQLAENFFDSTSNTSLDADELDAQEDALQAKLQNVFDALGLDTAIDLLNSSFSADHSGVDAALDIISIDTDENNIATITNLLDDSSIIDDITDTEDNSAVITVDATDLGEAVTDTVAIANLFEDFSENFSDGLPKQEDISDLFSEDFLIDDESIEQFFSDILTDPEVIGISFVSLSVNDLDSEAGTASVSFSIAFGEDIDPETEQWYVEKNETLGWQILGNQRVVDLNTFGYHCNDYDGRDSFNGGCGINTSFADDDLSNNGTDGEPILSASVSVVSGDDGKIKDTFYIGTPYYSSEAQIYNEGDQRYTWDWRAFGDNAGEIDPSIFAVGDSIEYSFYAENLDLSDPSSPKTVGDSLFTYTLPIDHTPQTTGKYPSATTSTLDDLDAFELGEDLTISWALANGTQIDEILVQIDTLTGGYVLGVWTELLGSDKTSITVDKAMFDSELLGNDNFNPEEGYTVIVRIYASDLVTGQAHSVDYRVNVYADDGGDTGGGDTGGDGGTTPSTLECGYESGWDENEFNGNGAPINPNSFEDFKTVTADCGTTIITKEIIAGTTWGGNDNGGTFNIEGSATSTDPGTGYFNEDGEQFDFEWYIEVINSQYYLVVSGDYGDDGWFRETRAITNVETSQSGSTFEVTHYYEDNNFSDDDRASNADGEIWNTTYVITSAP